jgi:hypothetical protein
MSIPIPTDEDGLVGRECPKPDCEGYFKIKYGTGLTGDVPCHCPYCGHVGEHDQFWTKEQIEYVKSVAMQKMSTHVFKELKRLEFEQKPRGPFGIGFSMKLKPARPARIHHYREKQLETQIVCQSCTLVYSVYGVFAFCPDCGKHNSLQILEKSLDIIEKIMDIVEAAATEVADKLIENALEDCVSAFDGFGRELCRLYANQSQNAAKAERISFQNLEIAKTNVVDLFGIDLAAPLSRTEWSVATQSFQKRHLLAHKMGVVDQDYLSKTNDPAAIVGRKVAINRVEVREFARIIRKLATGFSRAL